MRERNLLGVSSSVTSNDTTIHEGGAHDDDEEDLRFWEKEPAKDQAIPVLIGLCTFVLMCIALCLLFGRKWIRHYCLSHRQTAPQERVDAPIIFRR